MDNIFRLLRRNSKQILSFMLAFVVFVENPLTALASPTTNESFNISKPVLVDDSPENFDPDTYTGEPFYFDENGNRVYDSENEELQESRRQLADQLNLENIEFEPEQPDYSDIEWTFEDYPLTTMGDPEISSYIVGIDDAAYIVIGTCMAAYGVYAGIKTIKKFASNTLEPWIRRKYGNNETKMKTWQDCLATKAGTTYVGMKVLSSMVGECLGSATWKGNEATFKSSYMTDTTYAWFPASMKDRYIKSATWKAHDSDGKLLYQTQADIVGYYPVSSYKKTAYMKYNGSETNTDFSMVQGILDNYNEFHALFTIQGCVKYYYNRFYYDENGETGYYKWTEDFPSEKMFPASVALNLGLVFANQDALKSYLLYDTIGGLYTVDGVTSPTETIQVKKTWIGLQENFSKNYTVSDSMTVPSTAEASDKLLSSIYASDNDAEVISNLNSVWKIDRVGTSLTMKESYSHLSYVLAAIAAYAGASVTSEQIDSFINEYYGKYVDGSSTNVNEQAYSIASNWLSVTNDNGDPDNENKNNNKYTIAQKLASAFVTFLVAIHAIDSSFNITDNSDITSNIKVAASAGTTTKPGTGTGSNPDIDYSSSLGNIASILTSILSAIGILPSILSLLQAIPDNIKSGILNGIENSVLGKYVAFATVELTAIGNAIKSWDIEAWIHGVSTDLGKSIDNYGEAIGAKLDSLPHADDIISGIASALEHNALTDAVINIEDKLASFPIDNYGDTFIKALQTALAALGLGSLAGTIGALKDLTDIRTGDIAEHLKALADAIADLKVGTAVDLESLAAALTGVLAGLGLGELAGSIAKIGEKVDSFSLTDIIDLIKALPASIAIAISEKLPGSNNNDNNETENDSGFTNFLNLFMIVLFIIVMLLILFINCLRFIVLVFNIPAFDGLLDENILRGINYLKEVNLPLLGDNLSLYNLLLSCAYFVIFLSVIAVIRKKIDKIHI